MNTIQIRLCDLFRKELNLTDDKAAAFVSAVEEVVGAEVKKDFHMASNKEDIYRLELKMEQSKNELELKIEQTKGDIYKAMFVSGVIQLLAILSGVLAIVKFIK